MKATAEDFTKAVQGHEDPLTPLNLTLYLVTQNHFTFCSLCNIHIKFDAYRVKNCLKQVFVTCGCSADSP